MCRPHGQHFIVSGHHLPVTPPPLTGGGQSLPSAVHQRTLTLPFVYSLHRQHYQPNGQLLYSGHYCYYYCLPLPSQRANENLFEQCSGKQQQQQPTFGSIHTGTQALLHTQVQANSRARHFVCYSFVLDAKYLIVIVSNSNQQYQHHSALGKLHLLLLFIALISCFIYVYKQLSII